MIFYQNCSKQETLRRVRPGINLSLSLPILYMYLYVVMTNYCIISAGVPEDFIKSLEKVCVHIYVVLCGPSVARSIDIVVVLPISTSWMPMLACGFNPELHQYLSRVPCPCGLTVVYKNFPTI